jgi:crotonobetainyl-CoA:carnitine CoA-transferase CaiB-like acyl-CoA transferase
VVTIDAEDGNGPTLTGGHPAGEQVLSAIRVLDLSRWVAGEFCTKLFADFGAEVIKVERPGEGSLTRRCGPFPGDRPDREASALFLHLNTNKRSVTLDFSSASGRDLLLRLVEQADLVVESFRPGSLERHGLGPDVLRSRNPRLVLTRISAFGQTGPYRDREATGLTLQAAGGPMNATGTAGLPPHRKPGLLEHYTVGRMAGEASLAGLTVGRRTGTGSVIDVSGMETLLAGADRRASFLIAAAYSGVNAPREVGFSGAYRCQDGYVMLFVTNQEFWDRLVDLIAGDDDAFRQRYRGRFAMQEPEEWEAFLRHLNAWLAARPKVQIMQEGEAHRIPLTAFFDVAEVMAHPHFRDRGCFVAADHPVAGRLEYVGAPWRMEGGWRLQRTAPLLGADSASVLAGVGVPAEELGPLRAARVI